MSNLRNIIIVVVGLNVVEKDLYALELTSAAAAGVYRDQTIASESSGGKVTVGVANDRGASSRLGFDVSQSTVRTDGSAEKKQVDLGESNQEVTRSYSLSFAQTLAYYHSLQLFYDRSQGARSSSHAVGAGYESWPLKDRLRLGLFYQQNTSDQESKDFTDVDGRRVITPERIQGKNVRIETMTYLQPTTIALVSYSVTKRDDRPDAWSLSSQVRQYVVPANGAFHVGYQRYENIGSVSTNTDMGEVTSDRYSVEWHQKFALQYIAWAGYRLAKEIEKPRAYDTGFKQYGSDYIYMGLRYRFEKSWTFRSNEISAIYGKYMRNDGLTGSLVGLGLDLFW